MFFCLRTLLMRRRYHGNLDLLSSRLRKLSAASKPLNLNFPWELLFGFNEHLAHS